MGTYTDELILTDQSIIYINKGIFKNTKSIQRFSINQIKIYDNKPQVILGKQFNGLPQLEIYFLNGQETFMFQSNGKNEIIKWIDSIYQLTTGHSADINSRDRTVIPGVEFVAETLKGTIDTFKGSFGIKAEKDMFETKSRMLKKCISCMEPISGMEGHTVRCRYCFDIACKAIFEYIES